MAALGEVAVPSRHLIMRRRIESRITNDTSDCELYSPLSQILQYRHRAGNEL